MLKQAAKAIRKTLETGKKVTLVIKCLSCQKEYERHLKLGLKITKEMSRGLFCLLLSQGDNPVLELEIFPKPGRHYVYFTDYFLSKLPTLWLQADQILEEPTQWRPKSIGAPKPIVCENCRRVFQESKAHAEELAHKFGLTSPGFPFRYGNARGKSWFSVGLPSFGTKEGCIRSGQAQFNSGIPRQQEATTG
jgi:hypothetical protein